MIRRCLQCFREFSPKKSHFHTCPGCWTPDLARPSNRAEQLERENVRLRAFVNPAFVRNLVQLGHPDRHGGSALATEVTSALLEIRGALCQTR